MAQTLLMLVHIWDVEGGREGVMEGGRGLQCKPPSHFYEVCMPNFFSSGFL